ncbi:MaoC/PaaZ C-terminal domain-containing protein [Micromonospora sp. CA-111912]|uniref:MaoC/PaaZ C-terminal domain-containing protein n=1 Tax=Micromonospora sp. CA-111912 TaxID=3239955 RepID=UPI003D8F09B6
MTDIATPGTDPDRPGPATPQPGPDRPGFTGPGTSPAGTGPTSWDQAGPTVPEQASDAGSAGPQQTGPAGTEPAVSDQARPISPEQARPAGPDQARPILPEQARPAGPEQARPILPEQARPAGPEQPAPGAPPTHHESSAAAPGGSAVASSPVGIPVRSGTGAPAELFFEDLTPGRTFDLGVVLVDGDEMVAFARRFDPQWYHVDPEQAAASHHGGLIASGFYTVSLFMRAYVDHVLARAAADASPGLEELRWLAPVRAGDRLTVRLDVAGSRPSAARPGLGTVSLTGTMFRLGPDDQPDREVLRTRFRGWFTLRPT